MRPPASSNSARITGLDPPAQTELETTCGHIVPATVVPGLVAGVADGPVEAVGSDVGCGDAAALDGDAAGAVVAATSRRTAVIVGTSVPNGRRPRN